MRTEEKQKWDSGLLFFLPLGPVVSASLCIGCFLFSGSWVDPGWTLAPALCDTHSPSVFIPNFPDRNGISRVGYPTLLKSLSLEGSYSDDCLLGRAVDWAGTPDIHSDHVFLTLGVQGGHVGEWVWQGLEMV